MCVIKRVRKRTRIVFILGGRAFHSIHLCLTRIPDAFTAHARRNPMGDVEQTSKLLAMLACNMLLSVSLYHNSSMPFCLLTVLSSSPVVAMSSFREVHTKCMIIFTLIYCFLCKQVNAICLICSESSDSIWIISSWSECTLVKTSPRNDCCKTHRKRAVQQSCEPDTVNPLPVSRLSFQSHTRFNQICV